VQKLFPWKINKYYAFWVCARSICYPACKAHSPCYIVIYGLSDATKISTLSHKRQVFRKIFIGHKMCIWILFTILCETFLILRRNEQDMFINIHRSSCKVPLLLSDLNKTWIFWYDFRKILEYEFLRKYVLWEPSFSMRTDGQTTHDEANSRFSQFCESGYNGWTRKMYWLNVLYFGIYIYIYIYLYIHICILK